MEKVEIFTENIWVETSIGDFSRRIKGLSRENYPPLRCLFCKQPTYDSGIITPNKKFTPRFSHLVQPENKESCPLSSKSKRFKGLIGNEKNVSTEIAIHRRNQFIQFSTLREAWLICRALLGGKGRLDQTSFIRWIKIADSFGIWRYSYLPTWGIPLLLMLMDNHLTLKGNSSFYYVLKRNKASNNIKWQNLEIKLEAHWVNSNNLIVQNNDKKTSFQLTIPFNQDLVNNILDNENFSWCTEDNLKILHAYSLKELGDTGN